MIIFPAPVKLHKNEVWHTGVVLVQVRKLEHWFSNNAILLVSSRNICLQVCDGHSRKPFNYCVYYHTTGKWHTWWFWQLPGLRKPIMLQPISDISSSRLGWLKITSVEMCTESGIGLFGLIDVSGFGRFGRNYWNWFYYAIKFWSVACVSVCVCVGHGVYSCIWMSVFTICISFSENKASWYISFCRIIN